ncbi:MAG: hypothetical protein OEM96_08870 [Gemmatimonadota bacterium]|nr:hypothetical protein [Gemmatimonadota bacterium]
MKAMRTLLLAGLLVGCGSDATSPLDAFQPEISNVVDNFQLQASDVVDVAGILEYSWTNTGTVATVDHSTTVSAGSVRVIIEDAAGSVVYDAALEASKNEATGTGQSGDWTIRLILVDYDGTLNFRVQKS